MDFAEGETVLPQWPGEKLDLPVWLQISDKHVVRPWSSLSIATTFSAKWESGSSGSTGGLRREEV